MPLYKGKGSQIDCSSHRAISLISLGSTVCFNISAKNTRDLKGFGRPKEDLNSFLEGEKQGDIGVKVDSLNVNWLLHADDTVLLASSE